MTEAVSISTVSTYIASHFENLKEDMKHEKSEHLFDFEIVCKKVLIM